MRAILRLNLIWSFLLGLPPLSVAQQNNIGLGQFRLHLPYYQAIAVEEAEEKVYCATEDGFFFFDKEFNSLKTLSRLDGFSELNVQTLRYDSLTSTLLIVYQNTNIDLVRDGRIININDVLRKPMTGVKTIYHVHFRDKLAYLSASFGLVVLDLVKLEVKDTYSNLGPDGQAVQIYASTTLNDSLYVASSGGVMGARLSNPNLLDFRSWRSFTPADGLPAAASGATIQTIASFRNSVYAGVNRNGVFRFNGNSWEQTPVQHPGQDYFELRSSRGQLVIASSTALSLLSPQGTVQSLTHPLLSQPRDGFQSKDGTYWLADYAHGLVRHSSSETQNYIPNGPFHRYVFRLYADEGSVLAFGGGYDNSYEQHNYQIGFYEFQNGEWKNYNPVLFPDPAQYPIVEDLVGAVRNPVNHKLYLASYGYGLIQWNTPGDFTLYNETNSPLISAIRGDQRFVRVPGIAADPEGNIWMTNRNQFANTPGLHVLRPDQTWQSYIIPEFPEASNLERMLIDDNGYKWMIVSRSSSAPGILVFDEKTGQRRYLNANPTSGGLPSSVVYSLAKDDQGDIWVGTSEGVAVFAATNQIFTPDFQPAFTPIIDNRPLLSGQIVRAIAVDGGNRKWVGTETGLWLFNSFGDEVIHHFTTKNSPLPADRITDVAINHQTGEVFIGTEGGLVSYRAGATVTKATPDCATVFPNPVRPGFTGLVGISGLPNNALVKITDAAGILVYETNAEGGTATWNVRDYNGRRVQSGVYLVFSTLPDGSQSCLSKVAVLK